MQIRKLSPVGAALAAAAMLSAMPALAQTSPGPAPGLERQAAQQQSEDAAAPERRTDLDRELASFREGVDRRREELTELGLSIKTRLDSAMLELERSYENASIAAQAEWEKIKIELAALNDDAARQLAALTESAEAQWRDAHKAAAEALSELAQRIESAANRSKAQSEHPKGLQKSPNKS